MVCVVRVYAVYMYVCHRVCAAEWSRAQGCPASIQCV